MASCRGIGVICDTAVRFAGEMKIVEGNVVEIIIEPLANRDIVYVVNVSGFKAETDKAVLLASHFVK